MKFLRQHSITAMKYSVKSKLLIPGLYFLFITILFVIVIGVRLNTVDRFHETIRELGNMNAFVDQAQAIQRDFQALEYSSERNHEIKISLPKRFEQATDNAINQANILEKENFLPADSITKVLSGLRSYQATFEQIIALRKEKAGLNADTSDSLVTANTGGREASLNTQIEEARQNIRTTTKSIQRTTENMRQLMEHKIEDSLSYTLWLVGIPAVVLISIGALLVRRYTRKIARGIGEMKESLTALSDGNVPSKLSANSDDEIGISTIAINNLIDRIQTAATFAGKIGAGELHIEYDQNFKNDVLATSLQSMHLQLKQAAEENQRRNWVTTGLANFGNILRTHDTDLDTLGQNIITNLVKYLKANQGQLFVVTEEANASHLELIATYAWGRRKHMSRTINKGEGLAGQAWIENHTIFLKEIPADYMKITSGLGDAHPSCVLIVPLKLNDEVLGVVELGSFNVFESYEIEFVEKLGELMASTLSTAKVNARTRQLLTASQHQAEELRAQEEEMRQNMEELTATQEEMARKDVESSGQLMAINNSMATIEFNMQGYVTNANERFLLFTGYRLDEIRGKHHSMFLDSSYAASQDYEKFWKDLNRGIAQTGEFARVVKFGRKVWISASYTVVMNKHGEPLKVIKFAQDITDSKTKAADFEGQINAIRKSNAVIEFDVTGNILYANDLFLEAMGYSNVKDVVGHHHRIFVTESESKSPEYKKFWERLEKGEFFTGEFQRKKADGKDIWINGSYNPILDAAGVPYKVVKYASVINKS
jgi:methyl-accepting chemotaxis protein